MEKLIVRKLRTAPGAAYLYSPHAWGYTLREKDGVYGSLETQAAALAAGLAEWRATYPEDFEPAHAVTSSDEMVRGYRGTVARCRCGWSSAWSVQDGSAEADGHDHVMSSDPAARAQHEARMRTYRAEFQARLDAIAAERAPLPPNHTHECSCHLSPPCGRCENCSHPGGDFDDTCEFDCQECPGDHPY